MSRRHYPSLNCIVTALAEVYERVGPKKDRNIWSVLRKSDIAFPYVVAEHFAAPYRLGRSGIAFMRTTEYVNGKGTVLPWTYSTDPKYCDLLFMFGRYGFKPGPAPYPLVQRLRPHLFSYTLSPPLVAKRWFRHW